MMHTSFKRRLHLPLETTPRRMGAMRFLRFHGPMLVGAGILLIAIGSLTMVLFVRSSSALERQLRETLRATAATAAYSINGDDVDAIRSPDDMDGIEYRRVSGVLRNVVMEIPQARFAYVLRRTDKPTVLEFVVDADAAASAEELDRNANGFIEPDEEPAYPGERYDVSAIPGYLEEAFTLPTTDAEVTVDQWGALISGYAPIRSYETGEVVAALGIDMDATEFRALTRSILSPFAVLLILLLAGMLATGVALLFESRQLTALSRINAERSGLLQLMFHQLGEPITILQWGIESLDDGKGNIEALRQTLPENLASLREGIRRLSSIIDTLQEAEKVELRSFELRPVELSLRSFLDETIARILPAFGAEGARINLVVSDVRCRLDPHLLMIVLRRIIENALEFSPFDSPVDIRARQDGAWVRLEIIDRGCGIPAHDLPHMFEKYHRASNAATVKPDGNGLGLFIARGILEIMHGDIHVDSREGEGTTVVIRIPLKAVIATT